MSTRVALAAAAAAAAAGDDLRRGAWTAEEDEKLLAYVGSHGTGHWRSVGRKAGLQRCGKSCRLRWTNYLRPNIRHGSFTPDEEDLIVKLHSSLGSRWSLIAAKMPGRTDNDIKNHWNTRLKKKLCNMGIDPVTHKPISELLRDIAAVEDARATGGASAAAGLGNPMVAGEEARRCFSDNLLRKAVRDYTRTSSTAAAAAGPSKYDSLSCAAATDHVFNLDHQSCSDHQHLGGQTADHCDVSAMAHSSIIQNEAAAEDDLHSSWEHSITSTTRSNCSMQAGGQDNNSCCSDQVDAAVELSSCCRSSCSRSPAASDRGTTFQSLQQVMNSSPPSRSCKNNNIMQHQSSSSSFQSAAAVICMQQAAAACEEPAIGCRRNNFNLVTDQCLAADTSYCNPATSSFHQQLSAATAASDRTSSTSSNSLVSACSRPAALHFLPMQQDHHHAAAHLPAAAAACSSSWPCSTIMNGTACTSCCSASYLDHQQAAIPSSTNMKLQQLPPTSSMRFSTVEQPDLQLLQMRRLQQQQPTGLANFNYHPAAAEAAATAASVTAPAPRFSHSILQQQQQEEDFKRPQSSLHQQLMQQQDHHRHDHHHRQLDQVVSSSSAARRQYNQSPAASFNLQQASAAGSQEAAVAAAPYLSLREPLSPVAAAAYNNTDLAAVTPGAPQLLLSSFAARPPAAAAAPLSSFNGPAAALISSFSSSTAGPVTHVAPSTGIRTAHSHHYDPQSPRMVLWDFQE
ncbi:hypothetical protein BDL97_02G040200 [Sphagnum fallax]|nr:hypothetical protein BDL97_02G040200 [Sphagnum fallax]